MLCGMKIHSNKSTEMHQKLLGLVILLMLPQSHLGLLRAQNTFEFSPEPISYQLTTGDNAITDLQRQLQAGKASLKFDSKRGYLDSVMQLLSIPANTQALVYSKTSLQLRPISPTNPRALYYNDEVYLGWVPGGDKLEVIVSDKSLGAVFYTLKQEPSETPRFQRDRGECLQCHANRRTHGVPGPLVRSLYTTASGQPIYNFGNYLSDHTSPFRQRWGGYYVTGLHGTMQHMGNLFVDPQGEFKAIDYSRGANQSELLQRVNRSVYPSDSSDIVALMVLQHQTQMQNLLTKAIYEEVLANHYDKTFSLDSENGSDFSQRRIATSVENLLAYMFFVDEFPLTSVIQGTGTFTHDFSNRKPSTNSGKSLYQLNLKSRMFQFPLSYMVYSSSFEQLGPKTRALFNDRIQQILKDEPIGNDGETYRHLTPSLKTAIRDILSETHPTLGPLFN